MKMTHAEYKHYRLYGIIGLVAVFLMGALVGFIVNGFGVKHSVMSENQCRTIHSRIDDAIKYSNYDTFEKLSKLYAINCSDYDFSEQEQDKQEEIAIEQNSPKSTCEKIEMLLTERLYRVDNLNADAHIDNAKVYANLSERGCPENSVKYKELAKQELEIARALNDDDMEDRREATEIVETYKRIQMQAEAEKMIEKAKKLTNPAIDFIIQLEKIIEED